MNALVTYCISLWLISILFSAFVLKRIETKFNFELGIIVLTVIVLPIIILFVLSHIYPDFGYVVFPFASLFEETIKYLAIVVVARRGYGHVSAIAVSMMLGITEVALLKPLMAIIDYENISIYLTQSLASYVALSITPFFMHISTSFMMGVARGGKRVVAFIFAILFHFAFNETRGLYIGDVPPAINWHLFLIEIPIYLGVIFILVELAIRMTKASVAVVRPNAPDGKD